MTVERVITEHMDLWTGAVTQKSGSGRGSRSKRELTGIKKLRELILELAVRGKLVPQDSNDEPAQNIVSKFREKRLRIGAKQPRKHPSSNTTETHPFIAPARWQWIELSDCCTLENGDRSKNYPNKSALVDAGVPFVNAGHLMNFTVNESEMTYISEERFEILRSGKFQIGDILFCLRGSLGKCALVTEVARGAIASSLIIARPLLSEIAPFLMLYLRSGLAESMIRRYDNGTAQPNLSGKDFGKFSIPLPPLAEQHRIVEKVDELMALCDQLEQQTGDQIEAHERLVDTLLDTLTRAGDATELAENWARVQQHFDTLFTTEHSIERLKQTILQLAVMGRLVRPSDRKLGGDAQLEELPNSVESDMAAELIAAVEDHGGFLELPAFWRVASMDSLASDYKTGLVRSKSEQAPEYQFPYFKMNDISNDGGCNLTDLVAVNAPADEVDQFSLRDGDLLFNTRNSRELVGKTCVVTALEGRNILYNNNILRVRFHWVLSEWVDIWLRSPAGQLILDALKSNTTNVSAIYQKQFREISVPVPSLEEQREIVTKVRSLVRVCEDAKSAIRLAQQTLVTLSSAATHSAIN